MAAARLQAVACAVPPSFAVEPNGGQETLQATSSTAAHSFFCQYTLVETQLVMYPLAGAAKISSLLMLST
jgi:hypothetical protein